MFSRKRSSLFCKQKGATLFASLIFLILMTIVSVSATKISILDILVSSNDQQEMMLFNQTENDLKKLTTPVELMTAIGEEGISTAWVRNKPSNLSKPNNSDKITNRDHIYECGGFNGLAISIGPSEAFCRVFDFEVRSGVPNTGVRDKHTRGAGKEFPNGSRNNYNNK